MTTETEGIAQCSTNLTLLSFVEGEIQVIIELFVLIIFLMVDGRRYDVVLNTEYADHSLYSTSSTQQVTSHRLGRTDVKLVI